MTGRKTQERGTGGTLSQSERPMEIVREHGMRERGNTGRVKSTMRKRSEREWECGRGRRKRRGRETRAFAMTRRARRDAKGGDRGR